ncbi:hypothetical protein [Planomonospora sphaerica]|nr:hypothetical protein [Planomonospora sphaerica]
MKCHYQLRTEWRELSEHPGGLAIESGHDRGAVPPACTGTDEGAEHGL